jgi:post-segregation antitoxin (ccd killing protein)
MKKAKVEADTKADRARRPNPRAWLDENKTAIEKYNARVLTHGVFSDAWRRF